MGISEYERSTARQTPEFFLIGISRGVSIEMGATTVQPAGVLTSVRILLLCSQGLGLYKDEIARDRKSVV